MRLHNTAVAESVNSAFTDLNELFARIHSGHASIEDWELYASICGRGLRRWQQIRGPVGKGALETYSLFDEADV